MKTLRFLSVFAIFGILFSCSAPKASRTYSKSEVLDKIYVGNWNDLNTQQNTWYATKFTETGNQFYLTQSTGTSEQAAINALSSAQPTVIGFDSQTGIISLESVTQLPAGTYPGVRYKIISEAELERQALRLDDKYNIIYIFEGTMKLKTN